MPLGKRMYLRAVVLRGKLEQAQWMAFLRELTSRLGMNAAGLPALWHYPLPGGQGGVGQTIVQPITESFLAVDTWPDFDGAYLVVCSCKPVVVGAIQRAARACGLTVDHEAAMDLGFQDS